MNLLKKIAVAILGRPLAYDPHSRKGPPDAVTNIGKVPTWRLELDLAATEAACASGKGTKTRLFNLYSGKQFLQSELQKRHSPSAKLKM